MTLPKIILQHDGVQVSDVLKESIAAVGGCDVFGVAVAYATVPGMRELLDSILENEVPRRSYWLFGLDDWITHPDAIALALRLKGATVKVAKAESAWKFHPKLYWCSGTNRRSSVVLGSANLTQKGLTKNVEAVAALVAAKKKDSDGLDAIWAHAWKLGISPTETMLADYRVKFNKARKARKRLGLQLEKEPVTAMRGKRPVLASDAATVDPTLAERCWIEVGKITGFQADQLEIKAEQALFFGLPANGGPDRHLNIRVGPAAVVAIHVQYFGNHMWRFWLPQQIPEVANKGLRPGGKRSPYVAVFKRRGSEYSLRFIGLGDSEFKKLRAETVQAGTLGRTTAREYGWV